MTTQVHSKGLPAEDPWADSIQPAGGPMWGRASTLLGALPGELEVAGDTVAGALRAVGSSMSSAPDDSLLVGASIASGLAIGLLLGGAPRLLATGAMVAAVSMGVTLAQRHPGHRTAHFVGRPVMA